MTDDQTNHERGAMSDCHICGRTSFSMLSNNTMPTCQCAYEIERMYNRIESLRETALKFGNEAEKVTAERDAALAEVEKYKAECAKLKSVLLKGAVKEPPQWVKDIPYSPAGAPEVIHAINKTTKGHT